MEKDKFREKLLETAAEGIASLKKDNEQANNPFVAEMIPLIEKYISDPEYATAAAMMFAMARTALVENENTRVLIWTAMLASQMSAVEKVTSYGKVMSIIDRLGTLAEEEGFDMRVVDIDDLREVYNTKTAGKKKEETH